MKCSTENCKNYIKSGKFCSTCRSRISRKNNPIRASYITLKNNAKRRGKDFNLSFEDFKKFAIEVDYIKKKGIGRYSLHIDRKDENLGYKIDNIQVLTNTQNVKKYLKYVWDERRKRMEYWSELGNININKKDEDCPF